MSPHSSCRSGRGPAGDQTKSGTPTDARYLRMDAPLCELMSLNWLSIRTTARRCVPVIVFRPAAPTASAVWRGVLSLTWSPYAWERNDTRLLLPRTSIEGGNMRAGELLVVLNCSPMGHRMRIHVPESSEIPRCWSGPSPSAPGLIFGLSILIVSVGSG